MATGASSFPALPALEGVTIGIASAGIKTPGRNDLVLFEFAEGTTMAGVFTKNAFCAAPVSVAKQHLATAQPRYWLINTGNANAGTGEAGLQAAHACTAAVAHQAQLEANSVLPFSTGVIGEPLPVDKITTAIPLAFEQLAADQWEQAGWGILTTDTRPKGATRSIEIGGQQVTINGISKGSGMICPNMATMLAFVATDAAIEQEMLQRLLTHTTERSFNRITVDSDTSTNDACMLAATGTSGAVITAEDERLFRDALQEVMLELAQAIIRDGEGATKFITVDVREAASSAEALTVAYSIAHSPLVKTALYASDANWGRLLMAVGKAGIDDLDVNQVSIALNGVTIARNGARAEEYSEEAGSAAVAREDIEIVVSLARGSERERVWTSDLSHEYVSINADYRS
ncbi:bifunctional glutamate N-acetyltransferase/amino-acid acetyltransferase ArgJ [Carnimonas nigrificans]|uniref:bifunctional glutamate N-acetyltransferase/amino-acid acetyltransferase ArgJ n=1 Tax=Carnimonas nigrificans TaxID=64323 RepID=UPI00047167F0|nr:bifunctional glutamate N-acetyltransferase/amino-acid acetyltransferase ArgJ [Carnimonas nigrificans]